MMSLLPSLGSPSRPVDIAVHGNEEDEVMHGIGLRTSSHTKSDSTGSNVGGEMEFTGSCDAAVTLARRQKDVFVQSARMQQRLVDIFGQRVLNKVGTVFG
jgi:predicted Zn-dependent protease with MMP-like domain